MEIVGQVWAPCLHLYTDLCSLTWTLGREDRQPWTSYTSAQLHTLISAFVNNPYPGIDSREQLAKEIRVPESRVYVSDGEFYDPIYWGWGCMGRGATALWARRIPTPGPFMTFLSAGFLVGSTSRNPLAHPLTLLSVLFRHNVVFPVLWTVTLIKSWLSPGQVAQLVVVLYIKRLWVQFLVRAHASVAGSIPAYGKGCIREASDGYFSLTWMFLSHSLSLPPFLSLCDQWIYHQDLKKKELANEWRMECYFTLWARYLGEIFLSNSFYQITFIIIPMSALEI